MAEEEVIYTIPLGTYKPRTKRAESAIRDIRDFISRKLKSNNIWIDTHLNELIWARGCKRMPKKVRVKAVKFEDGLVEVSLPEIEKGKETEEKEVEEKEIKVK
ncbi:MAG: 50S ribosomal protein L31e [Candidatus Thermoplasmatota archaeon]|nr:50S ribosomal protein L31e [Candidatus Thermoplasmatota archaeon]